MAYIKQNFKNDMVLEADHLNKIEDQILLNSNHNHDGVYAEEDHNHDISDININADARYAMNFIGVNPLSSNIEGATIDDDTPKNWISFGTGYAYIGSTDRKIIKDFTSTVGCFIKSYVYKNYIYQTVYPLTAYGTTSHRGGVINSDGTSDWYSSWEIDATRSYVDDLTATQAVSNTWEASY